LLDTLTKGKFEKFNRKTQNNDCHIVWEDHHKPHCTTEYEKICHDDTVEQCKTDYEKQCTTEYKNECSTEYSTACEDEYTQKCRNWEEEECLSSSETVCKTEYNKECTQITEKQCTTEYSQQCSTSYEDQCTTVQDKECWDEPTQECKTEYDEECWTEDKQECSLHPKCTTQYEQQCTTEHQTVCESAGRSRKSKRSLAGFKQAKAAALGSALPLGFAKFVYARTALKKSIGTAFALKLRELEDNKEDGKDEDTDCYQLPETHCTEIPEYGEQSYYYSGRHKRDTGYAGAQNCVTKYRTVCPGQHGSRTKRNVLLGGIKQKVAAKLGTAIPLAAFAALTAGGAGAKKKLMLGAWKKSKLLRGDDKEGECYDIPETVCTKAPMYGQDYYSTSDSRHKRDTGSEHCVTKYRTICPASYTSRGKRSVFGSLGALKQNKIGALKQSVAATIGTSLPLVAFKALTTAGLAKKVGLGLKVWKASKLLESEPSEQVRAFRGKRSPSLMGGLLNLALNIASPVGGGGVLNVFNPFMVFNPFRTLPLLKLPLLKLPLLLKLKKKIGLLALLKLLGFKREKVPEKKCWQVPVQKCEKAPVKKCHKEQKCWTVPHKQCKKVPRQACWTVNKQQCRLVPRQECTQVPKEHCTQVPHEKCWDEPRETCRQVPQEACWDEPRQSCHKVPRQECTQVPHQKCSQVPHETCKQVPEEKCWDEPKRTCWTEPHQKCWEEPRKKCGTINMKVARRVCH